MMFRRNRDEVTLSRARQLARRWSWSLLANLLAYVALIAVKPHDLNTDTAEWWWWNVPQYVVSMALVWSGLASVEWRFYARGRQVERAEWQEYPNPRRHGQ